MPDETGRIPIVFGITGHRDIPASDELALKKAVEEIFRDIADRFPASPLALISPLAEGADRLVAEVALGLDIELIAALPMSAAEYEKDFRAPGSVDRFRELLAKSRTIVLGPPVDAGPTAFEGAARDALYRRVGLHVALHSHVLIALWDGQDSGKIGGTSEIVGLQRRGLPIDEISPRSDHETLLDRLPTGPIVHVRTRREKTGSAVSLPVGSTKWIFPDGWGGRRDQAQSAVGEALRNSDYEQLGERLNDYNADIRQMSVKSPDKVSRSAEALFPAAELGRLRRSGPVLDGIRQRFAAADAAAIRYRNYTQWTLRGFVLMFLFAFFLFEAFAHSWPDLSKTPPPWPDSDMLRALWHVNIAPLLGYLLILTGIWVFYILVVRRRKWQEKYEDYRALAEALRVQFFWRLGGVSDRAADHYLRNHTDELSWVRQSVRACDIGPTPPSLDGTTVEAILRHWIVDQASFFERSSHKEHRHFVRWHWSRGSFYFLGVLVAVGALGYLGVKVFEGSADPHVSHMSIVIMAMLPAVAAAITYYLEKRAYEFHVRRYSMMSGLYRRTEQSIEDAGGALDIAHVQSCLFALGREALAENGDWVLLHRERHVEPPTGG